MQVPEFGSGPEDWPGFLPSRKATARQKRRRSPPALAPTRSHRKWQVSARLEQSSRIRASLTVDQMKVKIPARPPAWLREIGAPNRDECCVPRRAPQRLGPSALIPLGVSLTTLGLGWPGGSDSYC